MKQKILLCKWSSDIKGRLRSRGVRFTEENLFDEKRFAGSENLRLSQSFLLPR